VIDATLSSLLPQWISYGQRGLFAHELAEEYSSSWLKRMGYKKRLIPYFMCLYAIFWTLLVLHLLLKVSGNAEGDVLYLQLIFFIFIFLFLFIYELLTFQLCCLGSYVWMSHTTWHGVSIRLLLIIEIGSEVPYMLDNDQYMKKWQHELDCSSWTISLSLVLTLFGSLPKSLWFWWTDRVCNIKTQTRKLNRTKKFRG